MAVLVDTNILLRSVQPRHPQFSLVKSALAILRRDREELNVSVQNLIEFWVVGTRPERVNGLGMSIDRVVRNLTRSGIAFASCMKAIAFSQRGSAW
jgi:hypothetical protein